MTLRGAGVPARFYLPPPGGTMPKYENRSGPGRSELRATDQQRDEYCRVLNEAYARGQLTRAEWDARSGQVITVGVTLGGLEYLVADLREPPAPVSPARRRRVPAVFRGHPGGVSSLRFLWRRVVEPLLVAAASWAPLAYFVHRWPGVLDREHAPAHVTTAIVLTIILAVFGTVLSLFWAMLRD